MKLGIVILVCIALSCKNGTQAVEPTSVSPSENPTVSGSKATTDPVAAFPNLFGDLEDHQFEAVCAELEQCNFDCIPVMKFLRKWAKFDGVGRYIKRGNCEPPEQLYRCTSYTLKECQTSPWCRAFSIRKYNMKCEEIKKDDHQVVCDETVGDHPYLITEDNELWKFELLDADTPPDWYQVREAKFGERDVIVDYDGFTKNSQAEEKKYACPPDEEGYPVEIIWSIPQPREKR